LQHMQLHALLLPLNLVTCLQELVLSVCDTFKSVTKLILPCCGVMCYNKLASFCHLLLIPTLENNVYTNSSHTCSTLLSKNITFISRVPLIKLLYSGID